MKRGIYKKCLCCGKDFYCYNYQKDSKIYCSKKCYSKDREVINYCLNCGKEIKSCKSLDGKKKYCSKECLEQYKQPFLYKYCPICEKSFKVAKSRYNNLGLRYKYCSYSCYKKELIRLESIRIERNTKQCVCCGKVFIRQHYENKSHLYFCSANCSSKYQVGEKHHSYIDGTTIMSNGYKAIKVGKKYVLEHRIIMENYLNRKLYKDEVVHHIDENKLNNNISNLALLIKQDHDRYHTVKRHNSEIRFGREKGEE